MTVQPSAILRWEFSDPDLHVRAGPAAAVKRRRTLGEEAPIVIPDANPLPSLQDAGETGDGAAAQAAPYTPGPSLPLPGASAEKEAPRKKRSSAAYSLF